VFHCQRNFSLLFSLNRLEKKETKEGEEAFYLESGEEAISVAVL